MKKDQIVVIDQGMDVKEVAQTVVCCKSGPVAIKHEEEPAAIKTEEQ